MKRHLAILVSVFLTACGGGGGGGGGGPGSPVTGTLQGAAFTPVEGGGLALGPTTCTVGPATINAAALILGFSSFSGLCAFGEASHFCDEKASATIFTVSIAKIGAGPQTPVGPGNYTLGTTSSQVVDASYVKTNAACVDSVPGTVTASGQVVISSISATRVVGSLDVSFSDGSRMQGAFDVGLCSFAADLCALATGTCSCSTQSCCIP